MSTTSASTVVSSSVKALVSKLPAMLKKEGASFPQGLALLSTWNEARLIQAVIHWRSRTDNGMRASLVCALVEIEAAHKGESTPEKLTYRGIDPSEVKAPKKTAPKKRSSSKAK